MRWQPGKKYSPIGLDLGAHSLKAVQLVRSGAEWTVAASVSLPRTSIGAALSVAEIRRMRGVLERRGFFGRNVVVAIPTASLLSSVLELPARAPGVPLEQIAVAEFARAHKSDASALTMTTWDLPPSSRASKATYMLAVGAKSAELETHIDLVEAGGFNVVAIEEPHTAAVRGCHHVVGRSDGLMAVIDLGWHAATLTVVNVDSIIYTRKLADAGLSDICREADAVAANGADIEQAIWRDGFAGPSQSHLDDAEIIDVLSSSVAEMLKEISQAFSYTGHQYPDAAWTKVALVGGGAAIPAIAQRFAGELDVPTVAAGAAVREASNHTLTTDMISALGLALSSEGTR